MPDVGVLTLCIDGPPFNTTTQQLRGNDVSGYDWSARADLRIMYELDQPS